MSEPADAAPEAAAAPAAPAQGVGAGALLRQAREAAGMHIGALSVALKVPVQKLEALEAERFELLPDAVFARALAASVCRTLKIDPAPVLQLLPEHARPNLQLDTTTTDRSGIAQPRALWHAPGLAGLPRPVLGAVGALLLAALVVYLLPARSPAPPDAAEAAEAVPGSGQTTTVLTAPAAPAGPVAPAADGAPAPALVTPPVGPTTVTSGTTAPAPAAPTPAVTLAPAPATDPGAAAATTASTSPAPPAATAASAAVAGAPLLLSARALSWVQVTDAGGTVLLRRTLAAGEAVPVAGALPLSVVVGRSDAVDVRVRGQAFDLAGVARDNVARFQVK